MSKTRQSTSFSGLTVLAIMASTVLHSCTMPNDSKPRYIDHFALNVVSANGSAHWTLADGGAEATLADSVVIFSRGNFTLFRANYDGSNLTQLYPGPLWGDHFPSPNGKRVLLASGFYEKSGYLVELYSMDADGTNLVKLSPPKGWYAWPRFSPDLDEIVFFRDGGIATINTDGTKVLAILIELQDIERFRRADQLASYLGLTPSQRSSGERIRMGHITHCGNVHLRTRFVQSSWTLIRYDQAMRSRYERIKHQTGSGKKAITAIARGLALRVRRVLLDKVEYKLDYCGTLGKERGQSGQFKRLVLRPA